eukprot:20136_6
MKAALATQELEFAKRTAADSQAREADLRKLLENARKDAEAEIKALQDKLEKENTSVSRALQELNEKIAKTTDESKEWAKIS